MDDSFEFGTVSSVSESILKWVLSKILDVEDIFRIQALFLALFLGFF